MFTQAIKMIDDFTAYQENDKLLYICMDDFLSHTPSLCKWNKYINGIMTVAIENVVKKCLLTSQIGKTSEDIIWKLQNANTEFKAHEVCSMDSSKLGPIKSLGGHIVDSLIDGLKKCPNCSADSKKVWDFTTVFCISCMGKQC